MGINDGQANERSSKQKKNIKPVPLKKEKDIIPSDYACALQAVEEQDVPENEVRILLLGVDGSGKSSIGNLITGKSTFEKDEPSKTKTRTSAYATCVRNGKRFVVVDSPCLFHTRIAPRFVINEVNKLIGLTSPGPHICVFVVPCVDLSSDEQQAMKRIQKVFLPGAADNSIVVLTKGDVLSCSNVLTLEDYTGDAPAVIQNIMKECNNRVVQVDSVTDDEEKKVLQTRNLFDMIELVLNTNKQTFYTNEVYKLAQVNLKSHIKQSKEKYMLSDKGISLMEKMKQVEGIRSKSVEEKERDASTQETLKEMESQLKSLNENMMEVVCDEVRDGILRESITALELNLRRLMTSGTKAIGSWLRSFMWFLP